MEGSLLASRREKKKSESRGGGEKRAEEIETEETERLTQTGDRETERWRD